MPERTVVIASSVGLHARPAVVFCQAVARLGAPVQLVTADGRSANGASILGVLSLGIGAGESVTVRADDDAVVAELAALLLVDHDQDQSPTGIGSVHD